MSIVPKKYHTFISPPLRRVFLDAREDNSRVVIEKLDAEIAALNRDKVLLMDRCDSAQRAMTRLRADERLRDEYDGLILLIFFLLLFL
jgi:hypothetical protein